MQRAASIVLVATVVVLMAFGVIMLYSTTYTGSGVSYLFKQLVWLGIGGVAAAILVLVGRFRPGWYNLGRRPAWILVLLALPLGYLALASVLYRIEATRLVVPRLPLLALTEAGEPIKGSFRWLRLAGYSLQPSEFAKIVLVMYLANYYQRSALYLDRFVRGFLMPMFSCGLVVLLILASGSLSATVITGTLVGGLAFIAGVRIRYLLIPVMAGVALVVAVLYVDAERLSRVTSFRDPESIQRDGGYQLWRSQLALGSGGWTGVGFTKSRMKQSYLPEAHTDCIVSIIGEELGFVAVMGVIGAYLLVIVCGAVLAVTASDRLGLLICSGVTLVFAIQVFVNISVVSGFGPTTGVTAPLISYGGSSVVVSLASIGLMLGVAQRTERAALRSVEFGPEGATTAPGALARRNRAPLLSASGSVGQRMGVRG